MDDDIINIKASWCFRGPESMLVHCDASQLSRMSGTGGSLAGNGALWLLFLSSKQTPAQTSKSTLISQSNMSCYSAIV